jgi:hypothetical protein
MRRWLPLVAIAAANAVQKAVQKVVSNCRYNR